MRSSQIILLIVAVLAFLIALLAQWRMDSLDKKYNEFTQERTTSWITAKAAPDTIFFISFNHDTTFYTKIR